MTFRVPVEPQPFLNEFGLEDHAWGVPEWVGLRLAANAVLVAKAYHPIVSAAELPFHPDLVSRLDPVMSSLHKGSLERYFRLGGVAKWVDFAAACTAPLSGPPHDFDPVPKPADSSFCVSVQTRDEIVEAITLLADYRALPDDESIAQAWMRGMTPEEAAAYGLAVAGIRSCGKRRLGSWHAMLSWTLDRTGEWRKAVSLRFPEPEEEPDAATG